MKRRILIKLGGKAFDQKTGFRWLASTCQSLPTIDFIIVHGGGKEITAALKRAKRPVQFINGLRVTPAEDIKIIERVLSGSINKKIYHLLSQHGMLCSRLSGRTDHLLEVEPYSQSAIDLGYVGRVIRVNPEPILSCLKMNHIPIISPLSEDSFGNPYNVNADEAAAAIAVGTTCTDLIFFTDVPGVQTNGDLFPYLNSKQAEYLITSGIITDGMIPKLQSAIFAVKGHVHRVFITQWQNEQTLLEYIGENYQRGTLLTL